MAQVVPSLSPPSNRSSSSTSISSLPSNSIMHHATVHAGSANSKVVSTGFFGVSFDSNSTPGAAAKADGHSSSGHAPATHTLSTGSGRLGTTSASAVVRNISQPDAGLSSRRQKSVPMLPAHTSASSQPSVQPPLQHSEHSQQSAQHPLAHSASPQYSQLATSPSSSSTLKPVLSANSTISGNRLENRRVSIDMATHISMHLSPSPAPSPGPLMPGMLSESATSKAMTIARKAMNRKDEVHVLFQSLSNLINTLGHERRLLSINENLEAIINARTRALQEMNQQLKGEIAAKQLVMDDLERARLLAEQAGIAKSHFLANMSHEIRTPMNAVIGLTDILSFTSLTSEQAELVQVIRTSANGLKRIIDDILDLTRIESGKLKIIKERFTVSEFAQDALDLVAYSASVKNITVSCVIMADVPSTVSTDRVRLRQIVINLLSNAIKFTPPNGRVELIFFRRRSRPARDDDATLPKAGAQGVPASSSHSHSTNSHSTNSQSNNSATAASVHPHSSSRSTTSDPAQGFSSSTVSGQSSGMRPNQFKLITPHGADESSSSGSSKHGHSVAATMKRLFGRSDVPAAPRVSDASNPRSDTNLNMISTSIAESVEEEGADEVANHVRQQSTQSGSFQRSQATTARNAAGHSSTVAAPPTITAAMASTIRAAPVAGKSVGTESSSSVVLEGSHSDLHSVGSIAENSNDLIYVAVVDTGPGMSRDLLKRLFTPFTQGDASFTRKTAGTGLGLSISRQLVRLLGGVIAVHSEVGRGSTFTFSFASNRGLWPGADAPLIGQPANPTSGNSSAFEHVRQQSHRSITSSKSGGSASTLQSSAATSNGGSVASTHASSSAKPHPREPIRLQPSTAFNAAMLQSALSGQDFVISRPDPAGGKREPDEALSLTEQQVTQLRLQTQLQHLSTPHSHSIHGSTTSSVHGAGSQQAHNSSTASTSSRKGESPAALGSQQLLVVPHPAANNSPSLPKRHSFSQPVFSTPDDEAIRPQSLPLHSISHPPVSVNSTIPFEYVPQEAPPKQITAAQHAANVANEAIATSAPVGLTASSLAALPSTTLSEQLLPSYVSSLPTPTSAPLTSEPVQVSPSTARKAQQQAAGAASASAAPPQPPQDATAPASRLRLLLAEDNKINQMVALKLLKRLGYNADVAWNGREAVNMCRLKTYDVVLMDLQMPEMDGLEACSIILAEHSDPAERPRIVALTANVFEQDREQCVQVGMVGFLAKPVTAVQLETLLSSMLPLPGRQEDYHDESAV
ncbi:sensor protein GacS [Capsaspora owczarzaki ATCC 30864]|nr:sensor protein GacS [Capsaspora owczarzaki ATCC 30864]|eukprot:XP_004365243.2 sensor protein GacS [Capsaspora owczarzaki ATCC 30864]